MAAQLGDIIRSVLGYTYVTGGKPLSNVFHWKVTNAAEISDADFINDFGLMIEAVLVDLPASQGAALRYDQIQLQNVTQDQIIATLVWPTFTGGTASSPVDASQVSALLRMITVKPGVQGRMFIPGIGEGGITASVFDANVLSAMADIGTALLAPQAIGSSEITYTVYNQVLGTDNIPTSIGIGDTTRGLNRRKLA